MLNDLNTFRYVVALGVVDAIRLGITLVVDNCLPVAVRVAICVVVSNILQYAVALGVVDAIG